MTDVRFTPEYGTRTEVCFDETTGGIRRLEIERPDGVDLTTFDSIRPGVAAADLDIPPPA